MAPKAKVAVGLDAMLKEGTYTHECFLFVHADTDG